MCAGDQEDGEGMEKIQQTIVVGLGATGVASVTQFKRRIQQMYGDLPAIKLIALDVPSPAAGQGSAAWPMNRQAVLGPTEYLALSVDSAFGSYGNAKARFPWLPDSLASVDETDWWQTRPGARLAFHTQVKDIFNFLEYHLQQLGTTEVRDRMAALGFEISTERNEASLVVFAGLGDVVGSALLLDVTYLLHYLYRRAGLQIASTALLYMPPSAPSNPTAEANAYATLKEINALMDHGPYSCRYSDFHVEVEGPPYTRGCYIIDMRNERSLTLRNQAEAGILGAEWLLRTISSSLKSKMDDFVTNQSGPALVLGQPAVYSSLGLATYVLPIESLIDSCGCRLGTELLTECLLRPELFGKVSTRLTDFFNKTHLRPDPLMSEELRLGRDGRPMQLRDDYIARLRTLPYDQIVPAAQATVNAITTEMLPGHKRQIEQNARRVLQDVEIGIKEEVGAILREWPMGGVSLATQFTQNLRDESTRFAGTLHRRGAAYRGRNQQQASYLNQLGPSLKNAVASIPPLWVTILSLIAGVLVPLGLTTYWVSRSLGSSNQTLALVTIFAVWLLCIGATVYTAWRTANGVDEVRNHYVTHLGNRFQNELGLMLVDTASTLYPDVTVIADTELSQLKRFADELTRTARVLRDRIAPDALCGEIDFALQRSVLTEEIVDELYGRYLGQGKAEARVTALLSDMGTLDTWPAQSSQAVEANLQTYGRRVFSPMHELRAEGLLKRQLATESETERRMREFQDKAAPLWTYDQFSLGQAHATDDRTYVGLADPDASEIKRSLEKINPSTVFAATGDSYSVIVSSIRRNMPLFALRRMNEFRQHYLGAIAHLPLLVHLEDNMALSSDLAATSIERTEWSAVTAFAVGRAFEFVTRGDDGTYGVPSMTQMGTSWLCPDAIRSVILLGANEKLWLHLAELIEAKVANEGVDTSVVTLNDYLSQPALTDWERRHIEQFVSLLSG